MSNDEVINITQNEEYQRLLSAVKNEIFSTRISVARAACNAQIKLYFWIGERIVKSQEEYGWGSSIVDNLSHDLSITFVNSNFGFSSRNLWDMRRFYLTYKDFPNLRRLVAEIPWGQNLVIMSKVKDVNAKQYYIESVLNLGWTKPVLEAQISSQAYERHIVQDKQHNFDKALPEHLALQAEKALKNIYMLDTLGLTQPVLEAQLENAMVDKIKDVLLELGKGFAFIDTQYRIISPSGTEAFIDMLFFNRKLKSLVALEIKSGKFKPEYAGKMNYYLNLLDDFVKEEWENPSIGIILCSEKNHIDVEYALRGIDKPMGVSEYRLSKELPEELSGMLPDTKTLEEAILKELRENDEEEV